MVCLGLERHRASNESDSPCRSVPSFQVRWSSLTSATMPSHVHESSRRTSETHHLVDEKLAGNLARWFSLLSAGRPQVVLSTPMPILRLTRQSGMIILVFRYGFPSLMSVTTSARAISPSPLCNETVIRKAWNHSLCHCLICNFCSLDKAKLYQHSHRFSTSHPLVTLPSSAQLVSLHSIHRP